MRPAVAAGDGKNLGFPDVCNTPVGPATVPMPYPNMGSHAMATGFSPNVFLCFRNALKLDSVILMTSGDEAGSAHPTIKGEGRFTAGDPVVHINHLPGIALGCPTTGNKMNNGLGAVLKSCITTVFFTHASGAGAVGVTEDLDALS